MWISLIVDSNGFTTDGKRFLISAYLSQVIPVLSEAADLTPFNHKLIAEWVLFIDILLSTWHTQMATDCEHDLVTVYESTTAKAAWFVVLCRNVFHAGQSKELANMRGVLLFLYVYIMSHVCVMSHRHGFMCFYVAEVGDEFSNERLVQIHFLALLSTVSQVPFIYIMS